MFWGCVACGCEWQIFGCLWIILPVWSSLMVLWLLYLAIVHFVLFWCGFFVCVRHFNRVWDTVELLTNRDWFYLSPCLECVLSRVSCDAELTRRVQTLFSVHTAQTCCTPQGQTSGHCPKISSKQGEYKPRCQHICFIYAIPPLFLSLWLGGRPLR